MSKVRILFIALFTLLFSITNAQYASSSMDLLVAYQYSKSDTVAFLKGESGELVSKATVSEPIFFVSIDKETDIFYIQTRHFIYKGNISTGKIIEEQRVYENEEVIANIDYNINIIPSGVNNKGIALWTYHKELVEVQKEMARTTKPLKQLKIANKMNKLVQAPKPYVQYSFDTKALTEYGSYVMTDKYPFALQSDDNLWFINLTDGAIELKGRENKNIVKSYDTQTPLKFNPKLKDLVGKGNAPSIIGGDLFALTFYATNPNNIDETTTVICNNKLRRVITTYKGTQSAGSQYPLSFVDSDKYVFAKTVTTFKQPKPEMPPQPKIGAFGAKKKLKEYQAQLDAYQVEHKKWLDQKYLPENNNILFFNDKDMSGEPVLVVEGGVHAQVYNNTNIFVIKKDKVVMYDLDSASEKWTVKL
ncbi:hypothetical protein [Algibacter sp. PT7-4]|uniref:hypothetical protein n=1 Tax=Algibacter ulvanivorans TaxID=3400999 RepID=UPI003AB0F871